MAYFSIKKIKKEHSNIVFTEMQAFEKRMYSLQKENQKTNSTMSVMLCTGANFAKKNFCLIARIVPYYTSGLRMLTIHILEPYPVQRYCTWSPSRYLK